MAEPRLPPRLARIALLIGQGLSTKQIRQETGLTPRTVEKYIELAARRIPGSGKPRWKLWQWAKDQSA